MKAINKHSVLKDCRENGAWYGYIAPSNVNSFHITGGWHLGMAFNIIFENGEYWHYYQGELEPLQTALNNFAYYNCCHNETGKRVRFWK